MAPTCSDPKQILVVLDLPGRTELYRLISQITTYMRSQLDLHEQQHENAIHEAALSTKQDRHATAPGTTSDAAKGPRQDETNAAISNKPTVPSQRLLLLRREAIRHLERWRLDVLRKTRELGILEKDNAEIVEERRKRLVKIRDLKDDSAVDDQEYTTFKKGYSANGVSYGDTDKAESCHVYRPFPTKLRGTSLADRKEVLSAVLVLLLSTGNYSAYSRTLIAYLSSSLELPLSFLTNEEKEIAKTMIEKTSEAEVANEKNRMSADAEAQKQKEKIQAGRFWKVGLASIGGAAIIGVTGGLAAPVVAGAIGGLMGSVGLGGLASFLGVFWMNGALVGTLFGAFGARMTGEMVDKYAREVQDFRFLPLHDAEKGDTHKVAGNLRRLRVTIGINGWLMAEDEVTKPWRVLGDETEAFALRYEMDSLLKLGHALEDLVSSYAWSAIRLEILRRTVLATLWAALWPVQILSLAAGVDNPFSLAKNRSEKAGQILADALINKVQGERPVTLIGYSLGSRVIYCCLKTLAERKAFGLIDTVVFIGAPVPSNRHHWEMMRSVVSGKMFNVFSQNDYVLAFLYRATSVQLGIAGLQAVENIPGVENLDLSDEVKGHLRYPDLIGQILARCGFPDIEGGDLPIDAEEIRLEDLDESSENGILTELDPRPEPEVSPVKVKPFARRAHRQISFPSGMSTSEEQPLVKKVKSLSISEGAPPQSSKELDINSIESSKSSKDASASTANIEKESI